MPRVSSPFDADECYTTTTRSTSPLHFLYPTMLAQCHHNHTSAATPSGTSSSHNNHNNHSSTYHPHSHSHRDTHHTKESMHTHTLSSPHHSSHGTKRESRQADISRLLDPAYRPSSSSTSPRATQHAYVDPHGDLHDPDFRHFPSGLSRLSKTRAASPTSKAGGYRPHWAHEEESDSALVDDEDEQLSADDHQLDADSAFFLSHPRYTTPTSRRSSNTSHLRVQRESPSYAYSSYTPSSASSAYSPTYYSPTPTASTLPTSYESGDTVLSESPFDAERPEGGCRKGVLVMGAKKRRRLSKGDKEKERRASFDAPVEEAPKEQTGSEAERAEEEERRREERDEEERDGEELIAGAEGAEYVPTCGESLKRQWQAISLRFRFGVFRAQRRVRRRVNSLL